MNCYFVIFDRACCNFCIAFFFYEPNALFVLDFKELRFFEGKGGLGTFSALVVLERNIGMASF